ncbi:MAG: KpsF/GutQ family sugar-phosphate isomerase [Bacteroidetes bacterium]|nr:KpsF/GutQ family sugar-phosphate isomerase [Bacteroidota bacterium]HET6243295.1 KpsF/GutQ family sugar-phosphate isomerase [Bacteroidia bacterium]
MKTNDEIIKIAATTLKTEAEAVRKIADFVNVDFAECVKFIHNSKGRLIVTGVGKSAIIASKIVATLNSTGTPSIFMHAADAIHGDLGIVQTDDIVLCLSKSGSTPEIKVLVPLVKKNGNKLVALVGNISSYLANEADFVLNATVDKEACPNNLAPTSSTTAQLALGDALAVCLLDLKGFSSADFAKYHPGGSLGKRLYMTVYDLCKGNEKPLVKMDSSLKDVILEISSKRLGATAVVENELLKGIITDGDLRRMLQKDTDISVLKARDIMSVGPKSIEAEELAVHALALFQSQNITQLIVTDKGKYCGFIHFHDLLREGII